MEYLTGYNRGPVSCFLFCFVSENGGEARDIGGSVTCVDDVPDGVHHKAVRVSLDTGCPLMYVDCKVPRLLNPALECQ